MWPIIHRQHITTPERVHGNFKHVRPLALSNVLDAALRRVAGALKGRRKISNICLGDRQRSKYLGHTRRIYMEGHEWPNI
jgi:hypothetical protein